MDNTILIFVFFGKQSRKNARGFTSLYEPKREKDERHNYGVLDLSPANEEQAPQTAHLKFTDKFKPLFLSGKANDKIAVIAPEGSTVCIVLIGGFTDIDQYEVDDHFTFEWGASKAQEEDKFEETSDENHPKKTLFSRVRGKITKSFLTAANIEDEEEETYEGEIEDEEEEIYEGKIKVFKEPVFLIDFQKNIPKPKNSILVEGAVYHDLGQYTWLSTNYVDMETMQRISASISNAQCLEIDEERLDNFDDILKFFMSSNMTLDREQMVLNYNAIICNKEICNVVGEISTIDDEKHFCDVSVNDKSLNYVATFYKLFSSQCVHTRNNLKEKDIRNYNVYFCAPFYSYESFLAALQLDITMKHSVLIFHDLNRNFFSKALCCEATEFPFYGSCTINATIQALKDPNYFQTLLEQKVKVYSNYMFNKLEQLASREW